MDVRMHVRLTARMKATKQILHMFFRYSLCPFFASSEFVRLPFKRFGSPEFTLPTDRQVIALRVDQDKRHQIDIVLVDTDYSQ